MRDAAPERDTRDAVERAAGALADDIMQSVSADQRGDRAECQTALDHLDYTADTLRELIDICEECAFDDLSVVLSKAHLAVLLERQQRTPSGL